MSKRWSADEVELLRSLFFQGVSLPTIANTLGRSYDAASLKAHDIGLAFAAPSVRRHVNENTFRNLGPDSAWLLGLLLADGTWGSEVRPYSLGFSSTEEDLAIQVNAVLESDYPIYARDPSASKGCFGKKTQYRLYINSKELIQSLDDMGIPRLKKDRAEFPPMHPDLLRHFIRGYFDGDGGVSSKRRGQGQAYFAGPLAFAGRLRDHIISIGITPGKLYEPSQTHGVGTFHIMQHTELPKLWDFLYPNATTYSRRKYKLWEELLWNIG